MTRDTDLIRRGDAISWCDKWIAAFGAVEIRHTSAREYALYAVEDLRDALHSIPPHPVQEPPSPGVTAGATGMPPSIWAWYVHPNMQNEHMEGGWTETQDKRETLYIRADLATPAPVVPVGARVAGWQPIETAPRDGTIIVAISGVAGHNGYSIIFWDEDGWAGYTAEDEKRLVRFPPALWCDIPEPPAALLPAGEGE